MRGLRNSDIFRMSKIISKLGIKMEDVTGKTQDQVGAEIMLKIAENIHLAEEEVTAFVADLAGMTPEAFADLPIDEGMKLIKEVPQLKGFTDFFTHAIK